MQTAKTGSHRTVDSLRDVLGRIHKRLLEDVEEGGGEMAGAGGAPEMDAKNDAPHALDAARHSRRRQALILLHTTLWKTGFSRYFWPGAS